MQKQQKLKLIKSARGCKDLKRISKKLQNIFHKKLLGKMFDFFIFKWFGPLQAHKNFLCNKKTFASTKVLKQVLEFCKVLMLCNGRKI